MQEIERLKQAGELRPFPLNPAYLVARDGRIANAAQTGWLSPCVLKRGGYLGVSLWADNKGRTWPVHQVVAWTWIGPRPSPAHAVAHGDGDRTHNAADNLRWATKVENEGDKVGHGRTNRGERNGMARLTDAECAEIKAYCAEGRRGCQRRMAEKFGVSDGAISNIVRGVRRVH